MHRVLFLLRDFTDYHLSCLNSCLINDLFSIIGGKSAVVAGHAVTQAGWSTISVWFWWSFKTNVFTVLVSWFLACGLITSQTSISIAVGSIAISILLVTNLFQDFLNLFAGSYTNGYWKFFSYFGLGLRILKLTSFPVIKAVLLGSLISQVVASSLAHISFLLKWVFFPENLVNINRNFSAHMILSVPWFDSFPLWEHWLLLSLRLYQHDRLPKIDVNGRSSFFKFLQPIPRTAQWTVDPWFTNLGLLLLVFSDFLFQTSFQLSCELIRFNLVLDLRFASFLQLLMSFWREYLNSKIVFVVDQSDSTNHWVKCTIWSFRYNGTDANFLSIVYAV